MNFSSHSHILRIILLLALVFIIFITASYFVKPYFSQKSLTPEKEIEFQKQAGEIIKTKDFSSCNAIKNEMYQSVCVNNIALNLAQETKDISYCLKLDNKLVPIAECERQIVSQLSLEKEDKAICQTATDETVAKGCEEFYLFGLANKKQDPDICDQDPDKTKADQCWNAYHVQKTLSPQGLSGAGTAPSLGCSILRGADAKADCVLISEAKKDNNPQKLEMSCQNLKTQLFFRICFIPQGNIPGVPSMPINSSL